MHFEGIKTPRFGNKMVESKFSGVGRNNIVENVLKCFWEGMKTPNFAHKIGESGLLGVGRNNIFEYLLFEMTLGRHENTKFCT